MALNRYMVEAAVLGRGLVMHIICARTSTAAADRMRAAYAKTGVAVTSVTRLKRGEDAE
jgi:hypothetical protein